MNQAISIKNERSVEKGREKIVPTADVKSVLFVCKCNICRSPAGESVLQKYVLDQNLESKFYIDSAGIDLDPARPSFSMRWVTFWRGYRLKQRSRRVMRTDLNKFDLIIAMDQSNFDALHILHSSPKSKISLLSDFLPPNSPREVPDPMNRSNRTCNRVYDMLEMACPNIVEWLQSGDNKEIGSS